MQVCSAFTSLHSTHDLPTTMLDPSTPRGSRSSLNPAAQGSSGQNAAGRGHQASDMQARCSALLCCMLQGLLSVPEQPWMCNPVEYSGSTCCSSVTSGAS